MVSYNREGITYTINSSSPAEENLLHIKAVIGIVRSSFLDENPVNTFAENIVRVLDLLEEMIPGEDMWMKMDCGSSPQ